MMMNERKLERIAELVASKTTGGLNRQQLSAAANLRSAGLNKADEALDKLSSLATK
ncbi:hypothetical protein GJ698_10790 [Pseudoduganella sp. FT26W]|uniref:Uncharacterized protein n=1 Tax=Duganella aquatilis TaxID=2666082 RepID=A0A844D0U2_9BURK|nr:hypothetical protein [Duganella aquatilis]MRW84571.1 hypothetical protein [Duganella aquatilis]